MSHQPLPALSPFRGEPLTSKLCPYVEKTTHRTETYASARSRRDDLLSVHPRFSACCSFGSFRTEVVVLSCLVRRIYCTDLLAFCWFIKARNCFVYSPIRLLSCPGQTGSVPETIHMLNMLIWAPVVHTSPWPTHV